MPELPEVEHVKRGITPHILHQKIIDVTFSKPVQAGKTQGKATIIKGMGLSEFEQQTCGYVITDVQRRSKYILFQLQNGVHQRILISHLGMAGAFFVVHSLEEIKIPNFRKHWQVIFQLDNGVKLVYADIRRFGEIRNVANLSEYPSILEIAPEPFAPDALAHFLTKSSEKKYRHKAIKALILDHRVISGCGNIYACEALFDARIHPEKKVSTLNIEQKTKVFNSVVKVLEMGILNGGTSVSDYVHADGQRGTMQNHLKVYQQKQCSDCQSIVHTVTIAGRNTHFCPNCQS
ncbi:bifunctional DNA-formamidopyrimidine glycosylase/DNA-(apurinic or apyrimidinic site) lyase [Staphylococcus lutrae]|uniref:Formamidopyrimidine-DNA glycosylase n=1 Tax=Staphylococcus lutrae TaxID=155085 RepID=A0AAC9WLJ2_9STAP|nr:bifunctional DNA-formamidopyrimidine glycosylase/DNA-(apurinic or apyrimidinic site) lyase [Staphylococcus lutrae]ARJ49982.1 DNA-formamidopyrimidine glycosylase [Staphylococcus lutrae]PNZ38914.1 bifunctional DNA-formamidopyrimidine glycosylase/DNA-(apurinic or apyrimidinic site) lyase [Staphylococcus lutrae]